MRLCRGFLDAGATRPGRSRTVCRGVSRNLAGASWQRCSVKTACLWGTGLSALAYAPLRKSFWTPWVGFGFVPFGSEEPSALTAHLRGGRVPESGPRSAWVSPSRSHFHGKLALAPGSSSSFDLECPQTPLPAAPSAPRGCRSSQPAFPGGRSPDSVMFVCFLRLCLFRLQSGLRPWIRSPF